LSRRVWISLAAVVAGIVLIWAAFSAFRGGVRETVRPPAGEPKAEPRSEVAAQPKDRLAGATPPAPHIASSLEEAKSALVKIEMPLGIADLMQFGTGFLIDGRGRIATNNHVIAGMTKDAHVKLSDGKRLAITGVVARSPERDLAILQVKDPPAGLTVLDIRYEGQAPLGQEVYAFGHPYGAEFSLSKGIVSRVLTTAELADGWRQQLASRLQPPDDMVWIQHDAKISPGNSGGPLIDQAGRVFGVNTFVHVKAGFGYASHVRYLRELAGAASDRVEPLPDPREALRTVVSSQRMNQLFDAISLFRWKPATAEQYESIAGLAKQMTLAKHAQAVGSRAGNLQPNVVRSVAQVADQKFAELGRVPWSSRHFQAFNTFAKDQIDKAGEGVLVYCSVLGSAPDQNALLMEIEGTGVSVVVRAGPNVMRVSRGTRWLVLGFVLPQVVHVRSQTQSAARPARLVLTHYMLLVR
jgi:S1-C subfamily serine protease